MIDLNTLYGENAEKFCGHGKFDVVVETYSKFFRLWITLLVIKLVEFNMDPCPTYPVIEIYLLPDTRLEFVFAYAFHPKP